MRQPIALSSTVQEVKMRPRTPKAEVTDGHRDPKNKGVEYAIKAETRYRLSFLRS